MPYPTAGQPHLKHLQRVFQPLIGHPIPLLLVSVPEAFTCFPSPRQQLPKRWFMGATGSSRVVTSSPRLTPHRHLLLLCMEKHQHTADVRTVLPGRKGATTFSDPSKHKQKRASPPNHPLQQ